MKNISELKKRKIKINISYDGTNYVGWQVQSNGNSVQAEIQRALAKILQEKVNVIGSSRTDTGVHAISYCAHFVTSSKHTPEKIKDGLNSLLPNDISIVNAKYVKPDFHAQRSAKGKRYVYRILCSRSRAPLLWNKCWQMRDELSILEMEKAAKMICGKHDFEAFRAAGCTRKDAICTISSVTFKKISHKKWHGGKGSFIEIIFEGDAFVRHMIRNIVGTFVNVGKGRMSVQEFRDVFASRDRKRAGKCAPACGLYLEKVFY